MSACHTIPVDQVRRHDGMPADRFLVAATQPEADRPELPYRDAAWLRAFCRAVIEGRR